MSMDENEFWKIISLFDWAESGDDELVMQPACDALAEMSTDAICAFDDLLSAKLHALDTRAHCKACFKGIADPDDGDDYISADGFLYWRCAVVANGRKIYESVLVDPARMPQDLEFESILYLAGSAFQQKTGQPYEHVTPFDHESFQNAEGWKTTPATTAGRYTGPRTPPGNRRPD